MTEVETARSARLKPIFINTASSSSTDTITGTRRSTKNRNQPPRWLSANASIDIYEYIAGSFSFLLTIRKIPHNTARETSITNIAKQYLFAAFTNGSFSRFNTAPYNKHCQMLQSRLPLLSAHSKRCSFTKSTIRSHAMFPIQSSDTDIRTAASIRHAGILKFLILCYSFTLLPMWVRLTAGYTEDSPSGLWRTLGKRVGVTASRVRISYPPPSQSPWNSKGFIALYRPSNSPTTSAPACQSPLADCVPHG